MAIHPDLSGTLSNQHERVEEQESPKATIFIPYIAKLSRHLKNRLEVQHADTQRSNMVCTGFAAAVRKRTLERHREPSVLESKSTTYSRPWLN